MAYCRTLGIVPDRKVGANNRSAILGMHRGRRIGRPINAKSAPRTDVSTSSSTDFAA